MPNKTYNLQANFKKNVQIAFFAFIVIFVAFSYILIQEPFNSRQPASEFWFIIIPAGIIFLYLFIRELTYKIILDEEHGKIFERGYLFHNRSVQIADIENIYVKYYHWNNPRDVMLASAGPVAEPAIKYYIFVGKFLFKKFPWYPIDPAIVEAIIKINPKIKIVDQTQKY